MNNDEKLKKLDEELQELIDRLYPPDWNPSDRYLEEWQQEFAIAMPLEDWADLEREKQAIVREETKRHNLGIGHKA